jgi:hypothetical protein
MINRIFDNDEIACVACARSFYNTGVGTVRRILIAAVLPQRPSIQAVRLGIGHISPCTPASNSAQRLSYAADFIAVARLAG